jgi:hypothetical protein
MILITRDFLIASGICEQGLADFNESFPTGVATGDDFIAASYKYDARDGHTDNSTYCRKTVINIKRESDKIWWLIHPKTRQKLYYPSAEAAAQAQMDIINSLTYEDLTEIAGTYTITVETVNAAGNGTMEAVNVKDL